MANNNYFSIPNFPDDGFPWHKPLSEWTQEENEAYAKHVKEERDREYAEEFQRRMAEMQFNDSKTIITRLVKLEMAFDAVCDSLRGNGLSWHVVEDIRERRSE